MPEGYFPDITHAIQLAVAPVFLLTAIGTIINALINRLARAVDRRRAVETLLESPEAAGREALSFELQILARRIILTIRAIALAVFSALLVCVLIGTAFAATFTSLDLSRAVALLFIAAVIALVACLVLFMREVFLAARSVHPRHWPTPGESREAR